MTQTAPVLPVYDGPGLANLMPALLGAGDRSWLPEPCASARTTVLLVIDGLGWDAILARKIELPVLNSLVGGPISSVVPSTTAAALTSITTGTTPAQHGLIGYRIRVDGSVLNVLSWHFQDRPPPDPNSVQRIAPFRGQPVPVVTKSEFARSGFTEAHLRGALFSGWRTTSTLIQECVRSSVSGASLTYAYYPGVDEVAHQYGLENDFYEAELRFVDHMVGDLLAALPPDCALLITSDHGQVNLGPNSWRDLGDIADLIDACSGDGRFRYLHARRGMAKELLEGAKAIHGEYAWIRSKEELLDDGWLGSAPSTAVARRIGDVVMAARGDAAFIDPKLPGEARLRSAHGSLTAAEMQVPLLSLPGQGL